MLDRHEDMVITGGRNPFLFRYRAGFDDDGKIRVLDVSVYNNAGSSRDLSAGVSAPSYRVTRARKAVLDAVLKISNDVP